MKVFKFLIKPLEFVVLLGAIAALIYFRSIIFHANVNQHIDTVLDYAEGVLDVEIPFHKGSDDKLEPLVKSKCEPVALVALIDEAQVEEEAVVEVEAVVGTPLAEVAVADIAVPDETSSQSAAIDEKVDLPLEANQVSPVIEAVPDPEVETTAVIEKAEVEVPLVVAQASDLADQNENAIDKAGDISQADFKAALIKARQSFWSGRISDSEKIYLDLASLNNSEPSIYGELGNVYYTQGKWKQAGEAYYEAAIRLLEQENKGQVADQVNYLLRVIQGLDMESAEKLKSKIAG